MSLRVLFVVCLFGAAVTSNYTNHAPLIPVLTAALGFGPAQAGLIGTGFFFVIALIAIPSGFLVDRFGPKSVGALGLGLTVAANAGMAAAAGFGGLLVWKLVGAVGSGACFVAGVRYCNVGFAPAARPQAQGWFGGAVSLGAGIVIWLTPALHAGLGWRGAFVGYAVMMAATLALWLALAPDSRMAARQAGFGAALRDWRSWLLGLLHTAAFGVSIMVGSWVATFLVHDFGLSLVDAGAIGALVLVTGVVSRPVGGILLARGLLSAGAVMQLALLLTLAGLAVMIWPGRPIALAALAIATIGFVTNLPYAATMSTTMACLPEAPGAAVGIVTSVALLGMSIGTAAIGASFEATGGFAAGFGGVALFCLVMLALSVPTLGRVTARRVGG